MPSILIGLVEVLLRPTFPDGSLGFFSVFSDLCNDLNYILCFLLGFSLTAADGAGMKEIISSARWSNLCVGTVDIITIIRRYTAAGLTTMARLGSEPDRYTFKV